MEFIFVIVALLILVAFLAIGGWFISIVLSGGSSTNSSKISTGMNEGDYHNGPHGYSPMTSYPNTQYGYVFEDDEHEH